MNQPDLIPKPRKRKRQPTADVMREQLRLAADEIIALRQTIDTTKRLMGWDRPEPPPERLARGVWAVPVNSHPWEPAGPTEGDVVRVEGRPFRLREVKPLPWYRRIFRPSRSQHD